MEYAAVHTLRDIRERIKSGEALGDARNSRAESECLTGSYRVSAQPTSWPLWYRFMLPGDVVFRRMVSRLADDLEIILVPQFGTVKQGDPYALKVPGQFSVSRPPFGAHVLPGFETMDDRTHAITYCTPRFGHSHTQ